MPDGMDEKAALVRDALAEAPKANPMRCEHCGIQFADKQPGSLCPKCYREVTKAEMYLDQIAEAKRDFDQWPEWMKPEWMKGAAVPPKAEPIELSDEEILALWQPPLEGAVQRPILGQNKILAFARAVLAHGRKR